MSKPKLIEVNNQINKQNMSMDYLWIYNEIILIYTLDYNTLSVPKYMIISPNLSRLKKLVKIVIYTYIINLSQLYYLYPHSPLRTGAGPGFGHLFYILNLFIVY